MVSNAYFIMSTGCLTSALSTKEATHKESRRLLHLVEIDYFNRCQPILDDISPYWWQRQYDSYQRTQTLVLN
jgi:hypothetical protein